MEKNRLFDLLPGEEAIIESIDETLEGSERLREMGLSDGARLRVIKFAPFGDPMEIKIRGFYLSIRKSMAKQIQVRRQPQLQNRDGSEI
jgi:ferrous iron transport protein A